MQPPADSRSAVILGYYRSVRATLLAHLTGREVYGFGPDPGDVHSFDLGRHPVQLHIADLEDLDEAVRSGIAGFWLPGLTGPGMVGVRVRPGLGSGIDTVATAVLALAQYMARDGLAATALTDGADGLILLAFGVGPVNRGAAAGRYAQTLASSAPEIATTDLADFDGRALMEPLEHSAVGAPAPYSLLVSAGGVGVVAPLTLDEVAAATAGMPVDIEPSDVAFRIGEYGDLAAGLSQATAGSG